jgi:hypothetical protein
MWPAALTYALANDKQRSMLNRSEEAGRYPRSRARKRRGASSSETTS